MTTQTEQHLPIPGLDVVGRGIQLRPYSPYGLKGLLFPQENPRPYSCAQTRQTYSLPAGYEVNDSPPMPAGQSLNHVVIEESWEHFDKQFSLDASVAAGSALFSIDASAGEISNVRSDEEAYYALRSSFIPFWTVYLADATVLPEDVFDLDDLPTPFKHVYREQYDRFFERYGTHFVKRAWIGGQAKLIFTVVKSSNVSRQEIQQGIKASVAGMGSAGVSSSLQESKEKLQSNSECTVWGQGGSEEGLAALSSLDEAAYNHWLATIKENPQVIELEVAGIWTLIRDKKKRQALLDAYMEATTFTPISAAFRIDQEIFFLRGDKYLLYHMEETQTEKPKPIKKKWPLIVEAGFEWIDAAFATEEIIYAFHGDKYLRYDVANDKLIDEQPRSIAEGWPGVTFERIDAALNIMPETVYFFHGSKYIRFNVAEGKADEGYPKDIVERWAGVLFDRIDAAIYWGESGKAYFFRDDQHIRYDMMTYRSDPGYPKAIVGSYVEDWKFFN